MSGRLLKCYGTCNEKYTRDNLEKVGSKNYCLKCAGEKRKEQEDRSVLYKTIQTVFKIPYPSGAILRQIKQFQDDRNYTLEGMTKCICYFVKVHKKTPYKNSGLAFVPYYYDSAIEYYDKLEERRKNVRDIDNTEKILVIPTIKHDTTYYRKRKIISMGENLLNDK